MYDTTPTMRRRYCPASIALATISAALMLISDLASSEMLFRAGLVAFLISATVLISIRTGVNAEVIEHARQAGYDAGYQDGQSVRIANPIELRRVI